MENVKMKVYIREKGKSNNTIEHNTKLSTTQKNRPVSEIKRRIEQQGRSSPAKKLEGNTQAVCSCSQKKERLSLNNHCLNDHPLPQIGARTPNRKIHNVENSPTTMLLPESKEKTPGKYAYKECSQNHKRIYSNNFLNHNQNTNKDTNNSLARIHKKADCTEIDSKHKISEEQSKLDKSVAAVNLNGDNNDSKKDKEMISRLRRKIKDMSKELKNKETEIDELKRLTNIKEVEQENQSLSDEIKNVKRLYQSALLQITHKEKSGEKTEYQYLQESYSIQQNLLSSLQEHNSKLLAENKEKENKINKLKDQKMKKSCDIHKLENDIKELREENESINAKIGNIKEIIHSNEEKTILISALERQLEESKKEMDILKHISEVRSIRIHELEETLMRQELEIHGYKSKTMSMEEALHTSKQKNNHVHNDTSDIHQDKILKYADPNPDQEIEYNPTNPVDIATTLRSYLTSRSLSFERFIFPLHVHMKLSKFSERALDEDCFIQFLNLKKVIPRHWENTIRKSLDDILIDKHMVNISKLSIILTSVKNYEECVTYNKKITTSLTNEYFSYALTMIGSKEGKEEAVKAEANNLVSCCIQEALARYKQIAGDHDIKKTQVNKQSKDLINEIFVAVKNKHQQEKHNAKGNLCMNTQEYH